MPENISQLPLPVRLLELEQCKQQQGKLTYTFK
jgi:hypothetical protein